MTPENCNANDGLLLQAHTTNVNKNKIIVHLNNLLASTTVSNNNNQQQHPQIDDMTYKSSFRSLNTPENTVLDMSHFYAANNIKNANFVTNHNHNSINYSSEENLFKENINSQTNKYSTYKKSDQVVVLQTKHLNFPIKIRPEYEIYQSSMDETAFKNHFKAPKKKNTLTYGSGNLENKENEVNFSKNKTSINGSKIKNLNQVKMYDFTENLTGNLPDEKISQKNYEKLPVIGQNTNFKNSSLFLSDSTLNLLEPFEAKSQNFTNSSSYWINSGSINTFSQSHRNERAIEPLIFSRNQKLSNKKSNNNFKPIEKKPKTPILNKPSQSIDANYIANGFKSASNEFLNQHKIPTTNTFKTKQVGYPLKQTTPTYQYVDSKSKDPKQFSLSLTNHDYFTSGKDKVQPNSNQNLYDQISNISENINEKIHKILRNYPSIHSRRMEKGKKPLPKLENYLIDNHIKYDIAKEPVNDSQKTIHLRNHRYNHSNEIPPTNNNVNISTSTDLISKQSKDFTHEETSSSHLEAISYYDINQSVSNAKTTENEN